MSDDTGPLYPAFLGAYVTQALADQVKAIAERDDRSQAWVIRQALKAHVANFGARDAESSAEQAA